MRTACYIIAVLISIIIQQLTKTFISDDIRQVLFATTIVWVSFLLGAASEIFRK